MSPTPTAPRNPAQLLRFTTEGITPEARVQLWEGHNARALIPLDIRTIDAQPMRSRQTNLHLPALRVADVSGTSQIVERSESFISEHPTGMIAVFFAIEGEAFFFHRGGQLALRPGQAVVYDADRPFVRGFARGLREVVLTIPRARFLELSGTRQPPLPLVFDFGSGAGAHEQALARLLQQTLTRVEEPTPALDPALTERTALSLLGLIIGGQDSARGVLASAKDYITRNLTDPDLSPGRIAAAVGISERQLGRYFGEERTSTSRYVLGQRVELAGELLRDPGQRGLSIGEIAARCGFVSQSHFGRVFREQAGMTPLQWRRQ
jgi:AraC-like DNA-binding protein